MDSIATVIRIIVYRVGGFEIKIIFAAVLFLMLISINKSPVHAVIVADQGQIFGTGGLVTLGTDEWSQSITTGLTGQLTGIQIQYSSNILTAFDFAVFDGGNPLSGSALFSEQINLPVSVGFQLFTWDVSSANLFFNVNDVFSFFFHAQTDGITLAGNDPPGYIPGNLFQNGSLTGQLGPNGDLGFITFVDQDAIPPSPVPLPAALPLFGTGLGLLSIMGWRRRRKMAEAV